MLRNSIRSLCASPTTAALSTLRPLPEAVAAASGRPPAVGIDGKAFTSARVGLALKEAGSGTAFKDPLWVTEGQLGLLGIRPRAGEVPVTAPRQAPDASPLRLYNVEQLENPSAIRDMPPQWIDDERVAGLDAFFLSKRQPAAGFGAPASARWFTVPYGLQRAVRRPLAHATVASFVMGFGRNRRGYSIVSEFHTEPIPHGAETPTGATARELQPHVFHATSNGLLFGNDAQEQLRKIAGAHGYKSTVWHRVTTPTVAGNPRFTPTAQTHALVDKADRFMSSGYVNGDDFIGDAATAPTTPPQVSGRTGTNFNADTSLALVRIARAKGFTSDVWITDRYVARVGCAAKDGQEPAPVAMGDRVSLFYNYDQLVDPPVVGAGAFDRGSASS